MRHNGRIEQRRRLRRILVQEVSAKQQLPLGRRLRIGAKMNLHLDVALAKDFFNMCVPVCKLAQDLTQQTHNFCLRQSHDAGGNPPRDVVGAGTKWTHQDPRPVRN